MVDTTNIADQFVELVPLLMRNAGADLRCMGSGLAPSHLRLLGLLTHQDYTLSELADLQAVTPATISNSIGTMVDRGWVERKPVLSDRRSVSIAITPSGCQFLDEIMGQLKHRIVEQFSFLSQEELDQLETGLTVLRKVLEKAALKPVPNPCEESVTNSNENSASHNLKEQL